MHGTNALYVRVRLRAKRFKISHTLIGVPPQCLLLALECSIFAKAKDCASFMVRCIDPVQLGKKDEVRVCSAVTLAQYRSLLALVLHHLPFALRQTDGTKHVA